LVRLANGAEYSDMKWQRQQRDPDESATFPGQIRIAEFSRKSAHEASFRAISPKEAGHRELEIVDLGGRVLPSSEASRLTKNPSQTAPADGAKALGWHSPNIQ
jgi:hypothetical protein